MLIVFEGIDGSGKTTQVKLFPADEKISFPRYNTIIGKLIRWLLYHQTKNQYLFVLLFALDRFLAKPMIKRWLAADKTVVLDRYTFSSMAHQGARNKKLIDWIYWLEFKVFRLPYPNTIILLKIDPEVSQKLMKERHKDMAEADLAYQQETAKLYDELAQKYKFTVINCLDDKNQLKSPSQIHLEIDEY